jgi:hypothetical protein
MDTVFALYDRLIFSEDDNVFSPNFLRFINEGLACFEDDPSVLAICGYGHPIEFPPTYKHDIYKYPMLVPLGFGTWRQKWQHIEWKWPSLRALCDDTELLSRISRRQYLIYKNKTYSIFPVLTKVSNMGQDGSGVHGGSRRAQEESANRLIDPGLGFTMARSVELDEDIVKSIDAIRQKRAMTIRERMSRQVRRLLVHLPGPLAIWYEKCVSGIKRQLLYGRARPSN